MAAISTIVSILDLSATRHISDDWTRFLNLTAYKNSSCITNKEQLAIKGKKNINLAVKNTVFGLLDALYVLDFTIIFMNTARFWHNGIGVYFYASQPVKFSFNRTIFTYADNIKN